MKTISLGLLALLSFPLAHAGPQEDAIFLLGSGVLSRGMAKEVCSCHFIYGLDAKTCAEWKHLPPEVFAFIQVDIDKKSREVRVTPNPNPPMQLPFTVPSATARFERDGKYYGCRLTWVSP